MRVHLACRRMSLREADILEYYLKNVPGVTAVKVFDRTQDAIITYQADRTALIRALAAFSFASEQAIALVPEHTSRQLNREYEDKLVFTVCRRAFSRLFLPYPITTAIALFRSVKYIKEGLKALWHGKLSVAVLDATAVTSRCSAAISIPRAPSCSCCGWARSSRSGRTRSPSPISRARWP